MRDDSQRTYVLRISNASGASRRLLLKGPDGPAARTSLLAVETAARRLLHDSCPMHERLARLATVASEHNLRRIEH